MNEVTDHSTHGLSLSTKLALSGAAIITGIVLAPYVLPAVGIGSVEVAQTALDAMHNLPAGEGMALAVNNTLSYIPYIGNELAKGGFVNVATTAALGMGGVLLGGWISKNHEGHEGIDWGKVIQWGALATSALIALPSILTGISNSVAYIVAELTAHEMVSPETGKHIVEGVLKTIGTIPYQEPANPGFTGAAVTLPHLLTCGLSFFPLAASVGANKALNKKPRESDIESDSIAQRIAMQREMNELGGYAAR